MPTAQDLREEADRREAEARSAFDRAKVAAQQDLDQALGAVRALRVAADAMDGRSRGLTTEMTYATDSGMASSSLAPGPSRGPVPDKDGPATKVMNELGFANLAALAKALGERHGTVRSWNLRDGGLPERVLPAIQKLREKQRKVRSK